MTTTLEAVRAKVIEALDGGTERYEDVVSRPITLADVLRAVQWYGKWIRMVDGINVNFIRMDVKGSGKPLVAWNLALNLDEQEPEVWAFLHKVLGV